jgi:hypothetical protein
MSKICFANLQNFAKVFQIGPAHNACGSGSVKKLDDFALFLLIGLFFLGEWPCGEVILEKNKSPYYVFALYQDCPA